MKDEQRSIMDICCKHILIHPEELQSMLKEVWRLQRRNFRTWNNKNWHEIHAMDWMQQGNEEEEKKNLIWASRYELVHEFREQKIKSLLGVK